MSEENVETGNIIDSYRTMWEEWGDQKKQIYLNYKFVPTHRIGLTNLLREYELLKCLPNKEGLKVLDVGCAAGNQLYTIAHRIESGHGIDIAQSLVNAATEYAKENGFDNLSFSRGEVENIKFDDETFDFVICGEVLEHIFDKDQGLKELLRVLKKGGILVVSVPLMNSDGTWWGRLMRLVGMRSFSPIEVFSKDEIASHGDAHVREYTGKEVKEWFESFPVKILRMGSASYIDGPFGDFVLKVFLHIPPIQRFIIWFEKQLGKTGWMIGRHVIIHVEKL